jgi:hypothetical protein
MPTALRSSSAPDHRLARGWSSDVAPTTRDELERQWVDPDAMPLEKLNGFLMDLADQPSWRQRADMECDYYDSNQYTGTQLAEYREKGIPPVVVNLIAPSIDLVLGFEAKTRSDWVVKPEDEKFSDEALAMTIKMKEFERLARADRACSDAYAGQIKAGLGWVEVGSNRFRPDGYKFRCSYVHRREIWWDWLECDDPLLEKSRYLVRRKWYDVDVAQAFFPQFHDLFEHAINHWAHFDISAYEDGPPMYMDQSVERDFAFHDEEWRNSLRKRVCLYEVWYRTYRRGFLLRGKNGVVREFDAKNPTHAAAIVSGAAVPEAAVIPKMRLSWWLGPHRLVDLPTPYPHQDFPYVPFWGFREDRTGVPYGLIRRMKPLQDEVNARRAKMLWQLSARRVIGDEDAVLDWNKFAKEVSRPDAILKLNKNRMNKGSIEGSMKVEANESLTAQQFDVYQDSKQTLQDAGGIYQQQLGKKDVADSGIAISQLIEQGTTTLAEINDNFRTSRTRVGELALALVKADMQGREIAITIEKRGMKKRVKLNQPATDEATNRQYLENDVTRMNMRMALDDIPQTPTARAQQFMQLTDMVKSLPENLQAAVIDLVIKASDLPQKEEIIARIRQSLGIQDTDPELMTPEEQEQFAQAMQQKAKVDAINQRLMELEAAVQDATAKQKRADAELKKAQRAKTLVEANLDPGAVRSSSRDEFVEMTPEREMIERAAAESGQEVPGAEDAVQLERARRGPPMNPEISLPDEAVEELA